MNYEILSIPPFDKQLKRLAKKYPSLKNDFAAYLVRLMDHPTDGTPIGKNCYKTRISISSKGRGKSGGARIITYVVFVEKIIYLLAVYDKSEKETLTDKELKELIENIPIK